MESKYPGNFPLQRVAASWKRGTENRWEWTPEGAANGHNDDRVAKTGRPAVIKGDGRQRRTAERTCRGRVNPGGTAEAFLAFVPGQLSLSGIKAVFLSLKKRNPCLKKAEPMLLRLKEKKLLSLKKLQSNKDNKRKRSDFNYGKDPTSFIFNRGTDADAMV